METRIQFHLYNRISIIIHLPYNFVIYPIKFRWISMEDEIIQWTVQDPPCQTSMSTLRHPGSAAAHQFQAAQGAEGLSHVQAETQGEHGWITSVPMGKPPIWENGNFWHRMLSADLISMDKKTGGCFNNLQMKNCSYSPFEEWFRILHDYIVHHSPSSMLLANRSDSIQFSLVENCWQIYIISFNPI